MPSPDTKKIFAKRLRQLRRAAGLTQTDVAEAMSRLLGRQVVGTAVTKVESGERAVRLDEAVVVAEILQVPLEALVTEKDPVKIEIEELRDRFKEQLARGRQAEDEFQQAQAAMIAIEKQIAALERKREDEVDVTAEEADRSQPVEETTPAVRG
ncbi:MAG: helix-turn-helix domain-containing protein [Propionibacteriaceae bacterium]